MRGAWKRGTAGLAFLLLVGTLHPGLASPSGPPEKGTFHFILENDLFHNIDRHYTNGIRLIWIPGRNSSPAAWARELVRLVPGFPKDGEIRHGYALGQSIFTPGDTVSTNPSPRDRPYAGWLNGTLGVGVISGRQLDQLGITFGVVGPASQAEQTQTIAHELFGFTDARGWDTQLRNEPGIVITYQSSWRLPAAATFLGNELDLTPHLGGAGGNVFTYANAGATVRYGPRLPDDYGPPRIQPGLPGSGDFSPMSRFGWYLFAGVDARAVARNIFLDGNTFRDSRSVDKEPLVGDLQFGIVLDWYRFRLGYTHILRSREFRTQGDKDYFGAVSVSANF